MSFPLSCRKESDAPGGFSSGLHYGGHCNRYSLVLGSALASRPRAAGSGDFDHGEPPGQPKFEIKND